MESAHSNYSYSEDGGHVSGLSSTNDLALSHMKSTEDGSPPPSYTDVTTSPSTSGSAGTPLPYVDLESGPRSSQSTASACHELWHSGATYCYLLCAVLIVTGIMMAAVITAAVSHRDKIYLQVFGGLIAGVTYIIYLVKTFFFGDNMKYLENTSLIPVVLEHIAAIRAHVPHVTWTMTCYHWETRYRTVSNGKTTRTESYQVKVTTWTGVKNFHYLQWWETSPVGLDGLEEYQRTRVKFHKTFAFADQATSDAFKQQHDCFVADNRCRDRLYDVTVELTIPGYVNAMMASLTTERPFFLHKGWYAAAALLLLEMPYSFFMKKQSAKKSFTYVKVLKC